MTMACSGAARFDRRFISWAWRRIAVNSVSSSRLWGRGSSRRTSTEPNRIVCPFCTAVWPRTRDPFTQVPFVEDWSRTMTSRPCTRIWQCWSEMHSASMTRVLAGPRPTVVLPSGNSTHWLSKSLPVKTIFTITSASDNGGIHCRSLTPRSGLLLYAKMTTDAALISGSGLG